MEVRTIELDMQDFASQVEEVVVWIEDSSTSRTDVIERDAADFSWLGGGLPDRLKASNSSTLKGRLSNQTYISPSASSATMLLRSLVSGMVLYVGGYWKQNLCVRSTNVRQPAGPLLALQGTSAATDV